MSGGAVLSGICFPYACLSSSVGGSQPAGYFGEKP